MRTIKEREKRKINLVESITLERQRNQHVERIIDTDGVGERRRLEGRLQSAADYVSGRPVRLDRIAARLLRAGKRIVVRTQSGMGLLALEEGAFCIPPRRANHGIFQVLSKSSDVPTVVGTSHSVWVVTVVVAGRVVVVVTGTVVGGFVAIGIVVVGFVVGDVVVGCSVVGISVVVG